MSRSTAVPLIWYKFESLSTSNVQNFGSAGVSLDATLQNGASVISNESPTGSTCLNLSNTPVNRPGQYLSIPPFTLGGAFSCSCWFKKANVENVWTDIYSFSIGNGAKRLSLGLVNNTGLLSLDRDDNNGKVYQTTNGINYCDNKWHHVVVASTGSTLYGSTLVIYIDYQEIKLTKQVALDYPALETVERVKNYIGFSSLATQYATIQVDDFRLYTTAINDYDIQALYNYKKTPETKKETKKWNTNTIILIVVIVVVIFVVAMLILRNHRSVITPPHRSTHNTRIVSR
jgi:hypothetical protein